MIVGEDTAKTAATKSYTAPEVESITDEAVSKMDLETARQTIKRLRQTYQQSREAELDAKHQMAVMSEDYGRATNLRERLMNELSDYTGMPIIP